MMDYRTHKVSFLNFIAPNRFWKILDCSVIAVVCKGLLNKIELAKMRRKTLEYEF